MKILACDLCDHEAQGETFEDWLSNLKPHYMEEHSDIMNDPKNGHEEMMRWMAQNKARFDSAPEK